MSAAVRPADAERAEAERINRAMDDAQVPPHSDGEQCEAEDEGYICTAAPGHPGLHAAYVYGDDPPRRTWPQETTVTHAPPFRLDAGRSEVCFCFGCGCLVLLIAWDGHAAWHARIEGGQR